MQRDEAFVNWFFKGIKRPSGCLLAIIVFALLGLLAVSLLRILVGDKAFDGSTTLGTPTSVAAAPTNIPVLDLAASAPSVLLEPEAPLPAGDAPSPTQPTETAPELTFADIVPVSGTWRFENLAGLVDCGAVQVPLTESTIDGGRIVVGDDPAEISVEGFGDEPVTIDLTRSAASPLQAVYAGAVDPRVLGSDASSAGGNFTINFTMVFDSPTQMEAVISGTVVAEGFACTVERAAEGTLTGGQGGSVLQVEHGDRPMVANCNADDPTPAQTVTVETPILAPTPYAALDAFLEVADPVPPATAGFIEILAAEGVVHYAAMQGDTTWVVIDVEPSPGGYAVVRWESSTC